MGAGCSRGVHEHAAEPKHAFHDQGKGQPNNVYMPGYSAGNATTYGKPGDSNSTNARSSADEGARSTTEYGKHINDQLVDGEDQHDSLGRVRIKPEAEFSLLGSRSGRAPSICFSSRLLPQGSLVMEPRNFSQGGGAEKERSFIGSFKGSTLCKGGVSFSGRPRSNTFHPTNHTVGSEPSQPAAASLQAPSDAQAGPPAQEENAAAALAAMMGPPPKLQGPEQVERCKALPSHNCGVSLEWLLHFATTQAAEEMTTEEVVEALVRPETQAQHCRYADLLPRACVGKPRYLISHFWQDNFRHTVQAVVNHFLLLAGTGVDAANPPAQQSPHTASLDSAQQHEQRRQSASGQATTTTTTTSSSSSSKQGPGAVIPAGVLPEDAHRLLAGTFVWLDALCLGQHGAASGLAGPQDRLEVLHQVIEASSGTLLVVDADALVLTRTWCLYEVWHTMLDKTPGGLRILAGDMDSQCYQSLYRVLDVASSQASSEEEREALLAILRTTGLEQASSALRNGLVESPLQEMEALKPLERRHREVYGAALQRCGTLLQCAGRCAEAEPLWRQSLEMCCEEAGDNSIEAAMSMCNLALVLEEQAGEDQDKAEEAVELYTRALQVYDQHNAIVAYPVQYAVCLDNLAKLLALQGRPAQAEAAYRRALELHIATVGEDHLHSALCMVSLAELLHQQGEVREAESLYRKAIQVDRNTVGEAQPLTASHMANLARLLHETGRSGEAEELLRSAVSTHERLPGEHPPDLPGLLFLLSQALAAQARQGQGQGQLGPGAAGKLEEALQLGLKAAKMGVGLLGRHHPDTQRYLQGLDQQLGQLKQQAGVGRSRGSSNGSSRGADEESKVAAFTKAAGIAQQLLGIADDIALAHSQDLADLLGGMVQTQGQQTGGNSGARLLAAEAAYRQCLLLATAVKGAEHPETMRVAAALSSLLLRQGREAEAREVAAAQQEAAQLQLQHSLTANSSLGQLLMAEPSQA